MRIIFANTTATLALLLMTAPLLASDVEYPPTRFKTYPSYKKCLAALMIKHGEARASEQMLAEETPNGRRIQSISVTGIYYGGATHASFSISSQTTLEPKPGGLDGYQVGAGVDWYCDGRVMSKGEGHSAYVQIPAPPLSPEPPTPAQNPALP